MPLWQVAKVHYAGLKGHEDYQRCQQYLGGNAGGVLAFDLQGGDAAAKAVLQVPSRPCVCCLCAGCLMLRRRKQ